MKGSRFLLVAVLTLLCILPVRINAAEVFKDGDKEYILEEKKISCDISDYDVVDTINDDLIFTDNFEENYIRVKKDGSCEDLTLDEILSVRRPHTFYDLEQVDDEYVVNEKEVYFYKSYYEKTKDTVIDENKTYYTLTYGFIDEEVSNPQETDLDNYYERVYVKHYDKADIDTSLTYYKRVGDTIEIIKEENPTKENIQYYYVSVEKDQSEQIVGTTEVNEAFYNLSYEGSYQIIRHPETLEYFLLVDKYEDDLDYIDVYNQKGEKVLFKVKDLIILHNSLYMVKVIVDSDEANAPVWRFEVYNSLDEDKQLLTTIDNIRFIKEVSYIDDVSNLSGYVLDDEDEEIDVYYELRLSDKKDEITSIEKIKIDFTKITNLESLEDDKNTAILFIINKGLLKVSDTFDKLHDKNGKVLFTYDEDGNITLAKDLTTKDNVSYTLTEEDKKEYIDGGMTTIPEKIEVIFVFEDEEVPKTFDGIDGSIIMGIVSLIGLAGATIYLKKRNIKEA